MTNNYTITNDVETYQPRGLALDSNNPNLMYETEWRFGNGLKQIDLITKNILDYGIVNLATGVTLDNMGNIYTVNNDNKMQKFIPGDPNGYIFANLPSVTRGVCFDNKTDIFYCSSSTSIIQVDINGNQTVYATSDLFSELYGIALDMTTKDIYVASYNNSCVLKIVKDPITGNTTTTKLTDISPNPRGIAFVDGVVYCSTTGNTIYQIIPGKNVGQQTSVISWVTSSLLNEMFDIISAPKDEFNNNVFYVSSNNSPQYIVKIVSNPAINIPTTITVNSVFNKALGDPDFNLNATSNNPNPIIYTSTDNFVATVDDTGLVTIISEGQATIIMSQSEYIDGNITYSSTSTQSEINVSLPVITVAPAFNKIINDSQFNLNATSTSPLLPINYESSDTNVATVDSTTGEITILNLGQTIITLTQTYDNEIVATATTQINIVNEPFGNITAMNFNPINNLLYVCSNNGYPKNFMTIDDNENMSSLNIETTNANIQCISANSNIFVGGAFNGLSGNQKNVNISELQNQNVNYSTIKLSVNSTFVDNIESNQTIGVITTNSGIPFEISKK